MKNSGMSQTAQEFYSLLQMLQDLSKPFNVNALAFLSIEWEYCLLTHNCGRIKSDNAYEVFNDFTWSVNQRPVRKKEISIAIIERIE